MKNESWALEVITDVIKVGDKKSSEICDQRILNDAFHETLIKLDCDGSDTFSSTSVQSYVGTVQPKSTGDSTLVKWSASFGSAKDNEVAGFCNPIYTVLLSALKKTLS